MIAITTSNSTRVKASLETSLGRSLLDIVFTSKNSPLVKTVISLCGLPPHWFSIPQFLRFARGKMTAFNKSPSRRRHVRYGFHSRTIVDGNNTDGKFWVGASVDIPIGGSP